MTEHLAKRLTITEAVSVYERARAQIEEGFRLVAEAEKMLNDTFTMGGHGSIHVAGYSGRVSFDDPSDNLLRVRHDVWSAIIERLEIRRMMSVARSKELSRQLEKQELPEITLQSASELLHGFQSNLGTMLEEAVEEVFSWLRPRASKYKTNSEYEVPRKVVLTSVVEVWNQTWSSWRVNYHREPELTALENVFTALDGAGQITKTHYSATSNVIRAPGYDGVGETPYFKFRTFKNGNMHLEFKREDLLARFNAIAGGRRLRSSPAA
jgi:hypothetical protein